jgi:hypothetical protein
MTARNTGWGSEILPEDRPNLGLMECPQKCLRVTRTATASGGYKMTKTIVIDEDLHVRVSPDGTAVVKNITDLGGRYSEKRRTFKTIKSALLALRDELHDALLSEQEDGEAVEGGDAKWKSSPYPLRTALNELEGLSK